METDFVKITGAAYRVLDFLPEGEPLKNKAKEKALEILDSKLISDIEILESYLEIAKNQGWISGVNYLIIVKQYQDIKRGIRVIPKPQLPMTNQIPITKIPNPKKERVVQVEKYTSRQRKILEILNKNKKAQVADLIKRLPDVTKRTLRRDLDELLKLGEVVRNGAFNQIFYELK